jgi:hypothetical protein
MTKRIHTMVAAAAIALAPFTTMPAKAAEINDRTACSVEQSAILNADDTDKARLGEYEVITFESKHGARGPGARPRLASLQAYRCYFLPGLDAARDTFDGAASF